MTSRSLKLSFNARLAAENFTRRASFIHRVSDDPFYCKKCSKLPQSLPKPCEAKVAVSVKRKTRVIKSVFANSKSIQQAALEVKPSTIALDKSILDSSMPLPGYSNSTLKDVQMKTDENSMESSNSEYLSSSSQEFSFDVCMIKNDRDEPIDDEDVEQFINEPVDLIEDNDDCVIASIKSWTKMTIPRNIFPEGEIICLDSDD